MQIFHDANALNDANANFNVWLQIILKMQMQIFMHNANALEHANVNFNFVMQMLLKIQMQIYHVMQMFYTRIQMRFLWWCKCLQISTFFFQIRVLWCPELKFWNILFLLNQRPFWIPQIKILENFLFFLLSSFHMDQLSFW